MTFEDAIGDILKANSNLTDLCSNIYGGIAPQNVSSPYLVFQRSATLPEFDKESGNIGNVIFTVDVYSTSQNTALEIADAAREALNLNVSTHTGFEFNRIRFNGQYSDLQDPETRLYPVSQDYIIWYKYT